MPKPLKVGLIGCGGIMRGAHLNPGWTVVPDVELAAWDVSGKKLWNMPLQPAWEYHVEGGKVHLDVLGRRTVFGLQEGPQHAALERR